jgi:site-specific DNA recombinase
MIPTHATKAGVRYRYYVSTPCLHGEAKTAPAGSVSRVPAAYIEDTVVKCLKEHLAASQDGSATSTARILEEAVQARPRFLQVVHLIVVM